MDFVQAVVGALSGVDVRFVSVDRPAMTVNHVWNREWSAGGGTGPFVALDDAKEGVRWSSPAGGEANNGPGRRPWLAERQRPFAATILIVGLKVGGQW